MYRKLRLCDPKMMNSSQFHHVMKHFSSPEQIKGLHAEMRKYKVPIDAKAYTMLIDSLCKLNRYNEALEIKNQMIVSRSVGVNV